MTTEDATKWIGEVFEEPAGRVTPETTREAVPAWDSLGELTLMARVDEEFGILFTDAQLRSMATVSDILEVLRNNGKITD